MGQNIEILAPAGDYETLEAAICAGADAVYAGGRQFGARAYAKNFNKEEMLSAIDYVHLHGRKLYLTVNTLIKEREFAELYEYLRPFYQQGLDGIIVQDVGVMDYVMEQFPKLPIHASTQMTVTNAISAKYLESLGVKRVVPARELSLAEIREISRHTGLEVECFVHGALCYCYSGQCLLSSMIGGRSGNRGQCAQPCRLSYSVGNKKREDILSLKDLCAIKAIPDLIESGVCSFKIEGRMKRPEYVASVTGMYRKYVDLYLEAGREGFSVSVEDIRELESAYQRRGYCDGYYFRHNGKEMLSLERPEKEGAVRKDDAPLPQEKITGKLMISPEKHVTLYLKCWEIETEVSGAVAEPAVNQPATKERIEKQLRKTGNTPFVFEELDICLEGKAFVPIQEINELRRRGIKELEKKILQGFYRDCPERIFLPERKYPGTDILEMTVLAETVEQLEAVSDAAGIARVYVEDSLWASSEKKEKLRRELSKLKTLGIQVYFAMARIFRREALGFYDSHWEELVQSFDGALARNLESLVYAKERAPEFPVIADAGLYQWNRYAGDFWKKFSPEVMTAPVELNRRELKELGVWNMELVAYGYLPVMVSAGCVKKNTAKCDRKPGFLFMIDRQNKKNIVKNECLYCYNVIYNSDPLMLPDLYQEIEELGIGSFRLQFSVEDRARTREILNLYKRTYLERKECPSLEGTFTRGHFKRGVK